AAARARAAAIEIARMALAPRRLLLGVPSSSIRRRSRRDWSETSWPTRAGASTWLTLVTARRTPLPRKRDASPSRSSTASCSPVEAPLGTAARPRAPEASVRSHSTVGLPRESRIWRAAKVAMASMEEFYGKKAQPARLGAAVREWYVAASGLEPLT